MKISNFDPPANVDDFNSILNQRQVWSEFVSYHFDMNVGIVARELAEHGSASPLPQFYNPKAPTSQHEPDEAAQDVPWTGFPNLLSSRFGTSALDVSDELGTAVLGVDQDGNEVAFSYRKQDEYLEWHADRDPKTGKVVRIVFTCEAPEYWSAFAQGIPSPYYSLAPDGTVFSPSTSARGNIDAVLELYRVTTRVGGITKDDLVFPADVYLDRSRTQKLFSAGDYNPWNTYNTSKGALHLTHPANTLGAEINLAARATIRRKPGSVELTDNLTLICCAAYGNANRNSDPTIGGKVNSFAQADAFITLLNPVGLYMTDFKAAGLVTPDGTSAQEFWRWERPKQQVGDRFNRYLRAVFEVPPGKTYSVGDIKLATGEPIRYGGQLASLVTMMLVGVADRIGKIHVDPIGCVAHGCRSRLNSGYVVVVSNNAQNGGVEIIPCEALGDYSEVNLGNAAAGGMRAFSLLANTQSPQWRGPKGPNRARLTRLF